MFCLVLLCHIYDMHKQDNSWMFPRALGQDPTRQPFKALADSNSAGAAANRSWETSENSTALADYRTLLPFNQVIS